MLQANRGGFEPGDAVFQFGRRCFAEKQIFGLNIAPATPIALIAGGRDPLAVCRKLSTFIDGLHALELIKHADKPFGNVSPEIYAFPETARARGSRGRTVL